MKDKDILTTVIGGLGAAVTAAQPVVNAAQGTFHQGDWFQLGMAVVFGLLGFFSNKK